jgi:hypothetical protein
MAKKNKKYSLSFVEEAVLNSDYFGCVGGRVEVYSNGSYADDEIRFLENTGISEIALLMS